MNALRPVSKKQARANKLKGPIRRAVFERDGWQCRLAGVEGAGRCFGPLTPHHVRKASQGGLYIKENLASLCSSHNNRIEADADLARLAESLGLVSRQAVHVHIIEGDASV